MQNVFFVTKNYLSSTEAPASSSCFFSFFSFFFRSAFFNSSWSAVNHSFSFFQTKTSDCTNSFDNVNFLVASSSQNNVEFSLLFSSTTSVTTSSSSSNSNSSSSRNTELLFHCFNKFNNFHY